MEQPLLELTQANLQLRYLDLFMASLWPMMITVVVHGQGMSLVGWFRKRFTIGHPKAWRRWPTTLGLIVMVTVMMGTHCIEVAIWAVFFVGMGMVDDVNTAMFFSMNNYSTLGASNISLTGRWKGFSGLEAMTAMLMFGWTTAVLADVVKKLHDGEKTAHSFRAGPHMHS